MAINVAGDASGALDQAGLVMGTMMAVCRWSCISGDGITTQSPYGAAVI
jgi:hypothetical protein